MRKVIVTEFMTLDGVVEAPDQWSFPYWNDDISKFKHDELFSADAFLLGRITYEGFAKAWPTMEGTGDFGERMNSLPKYVATNTLTELTWNSTPIKGNFVEEVNKLKSQEGMNILIGGSPDFAQTLIKNDLVDEYWLLVYPLVLGKGKKLFQEGAEAKLKLLETKPMGDTGVVLVKYGSLPAQG